LRILNIKKNKMKTPQEKIEKYEAKIAELKKEIEKMQSPEDFFLKMINGSTFKINPLKYPNSTFYFDSETFLLEIEKREEKWYAWFSNNKIWDPISRQNNWNYTQTQEFLKLKIEDHFKLRNVTANADDSIQKYSLLEIQKIEDHFKLREVIADNLAIWERSLQIERGNS
jgi:hypothetical protein